MQWKRDYTSVMIVPTGVGASIGGYAGDALPVARALSSVVDCLISHPNVRLFDFFSVFMFLLEGIVAMYRLMGVCERLVGAHGDARHPW